MKILNPYDRVPVYKIFEGESRTKQSFRDQCNINNIMSRYEKTGLLEHVNRRQGQYGDFGPIPDFHTALNKVQEAHEMFMELPAKMREQFNNDPGEFLAFVQNPENEDGMRELGLLPKKPPEKAESAPPKAEAKTETPPVKGEVQDKS